MIRDDDGVGARIECAARVLCAEHAFDDDRSLPGSANPRDIPPRHGRALERRSHILVRHWAFAGNHDVGKPHHSTIAQIAEQPRGACEKLPDIRQHFQRIATEELSAAVAQIAFALSRNCGVDRHDERRETRGARSLDRRRRGLAAADQIELIPYRSARSGLHLFEAAAGERR